MPPPATDGHRAPLETLACSLVDVVVLDIEMPGMSGLELYGRMLADPWNN